MSRTILPGAGVAGEALVPKRFVGLSAGTLVYLDNATAIPSGIVQADYSTGDAVDVVSTSESELVESSGAIAANQDVMITTDGKVIAGTGAGYRVGVANSAASGGLVRIRMRLWFVYVAP